jgi:hypothetical protein
MKTESEKYFEKFCERNGFALNPIPVEAGRTPDYTLTVGGISIMVEVKEIDQTPEEVASDRKMRENGVGNAIHITPGKKVRQKIADCYAQIKARTLDAHPGLLVLWERGCVSAITPSRTRFEWRCPGLNRSPSISHPSGRVNRRRS